MMIDYSMLYNMSKQEQLDRSELDAVVAEVGKVKIRKILQLAYELGDIESETYKDCMIALGFHKGYGDRNIKPVTILPLN